MLRFRGKRAGARRSGEGGFTVVEMTISLILTTIFLAGVVAITLQGYDFLGAHQTTGTLSRESAKTLDKLDNIIRGCRQITDADTSATQFRFRADVNADSTSPEQGIDDILINRSGANLQLSIGGVASTMTNSLDTNQASPLEFTYYSDWNHTVAVTSGYNASVRVVKVTLRMTKFVNGVRTNRTYSRYILLKLDPDDRKDSSVPSP